MTRSRITSLGLALLVSFGVLGGGVPANAAVDPRPAGPCTFTATDLMITSFDGVALDATYYVPNTATAAHPQPAILMSHGFPGWHRGDGDLADQRMLASNCYVVLAWTERGLGNSGGKIQLLSPDWEVRDASGLVDYLAARPEVLKDAPGDPRVGMFGGSYAGGIQTLLATHDHRVDVITPQITWNDLRYSLFPNGAIKEGWINLLFAAGTASGYCGANFAKPECNLHPPGWSLEAIRNSLLGAAFNGDIDGSIQPWLAYRSPSSYLASWHIPTMFIQGEGDTLFTLNEAVRNYQAVLANGSPTKLIFFSGGHGQTDDPDERRFINLRVLDWLSRYLRKNTSVNTGPNIEIQADWVAAASHAGRFLPFSSLPTGSLDYTLSSNGRLVSLPADASRGTISLANAIAPTSFSEISNFQSLPPHPKDHAPSVTAMSFLSAPLTAATTVIGSAKLRFTLTSTAGEAILFWKIYDQAPDGHKVLVQHLVTPIRVIGEGTWPATLPITTAVQVSLDLQSIVHRFPAGHKIVLTAATSDSAFYDSRFAAVYGIGVGPQASFSLPIAP